jgi:hypothetical protein
MVMLRLLSHALVFLAFPPPPPLLLFAPNLPLEKNQTCRLAAAPNAPSGMVNSDLLLLLLLHNLFTSNGHLDVIHCLKNPLI